MADLKKIFSREDVKSIEKLKTVDGWSKYFCLFKGTYETVTYPLYYQVSKENVVRYGQTELGLKNLKRTVFLEGVAAAQPRFAYKDESSIVMPSSLVAFSFSSVLVRCSKIPVVEVVDGVSMFNVNNLVCLLMHFPGLEGIINEYEASPDVGVKFAGEVSEGSASGEFYPKLASPAATIKDPVYTRAEFISMAYYALLMINKTLESTEASTHHETFTMARLKAFAFTTAGGVNCDPKKIPETIVGARELSTRMAHYPKLKSVVFSLLLIASSPEAEHAKDILRDTAMTPFVMVEHFITAEELTLLHLVPAVVKELIAFANMRKRVTDKYGSYWPFYKLIEPNGTESSLRAFKELTKAALAWKVATGETTLAAYKGAHLYERYRTLALTPVPDRMKTQATLTLFEGVRKLQEAGYFGSIDVAKLQDVVLSPEDSK